MSTVLIIGGAVIVSILSVGLVVWLSMKMTERKEACGSGDLQSLTSDGEGGYGWAYEVDGEL